MNPKLEEVFKKSGTPTFTFVTPWEYERIRIALRTPGRGVVLEGASGIGKTSAILKIVSDLKSDGQDYQYWSARKPNDISNIRNLSLERNFGRVIIDDFHRLDDKQKAAISDIMKILADIEDPNRKIVIIGINEAGKSVVNFSKDLNERIEFIKIQRADDSSIESMIANGEKALNIEIQDKASIIKDSFGCFHIAQMLCYEYCLYAQVYEYQVNNKIVAPNYYTVREKILSDLGRRFEIQAKAFASGPATKKDGRAPYLHLLKLLPASNDWLLNIRDLSMTSPSHKNSLRTMIDSRSSGIKRLFERHADLKEVLYYNNVSKELSAEDPKFMFYVANIPWNKFAKELGFARQEFRAKYDVALSFAGQDRQIAFKIFDQLSRREIEVFYDFNEQDRIAGESVAKYLDPIYRSEAYFVLPLISKDYPNRIWTQMETEAYRGRFANGSVIPIRIDQFNDIFLKESDGIGGLSIDTQKDLDPQIENIVNIICDKLANVSTPSPTLSSDD